MKNKILYTIIFIFSISLLNLNAENAEYTSDTLTMSPGYANDIFYSMTNGEIASVPRSGWDIAFATAPFSAGIIINEGSGVLLYAYPNGDTSSWAHVDTTGMSTWNSLINSPEDWEDGAFNRNATGHPDYGWGVYNAVTHDVVGDSIYLMNSPDAGIKKIWIIRKVSIDNIYIIKYANIDGSDEQYFELDINPYIEKDFIYYSLNTNELIDREPAENWDILFTKYYDVTYDGEGNPFDYLVTGATSKMGRSANKFYPVADDFMDWASEPFETFKNVIGYNWKSFDMNTFSWVVEDSTAFFVMTESEDVYKLVFTYWEGSSTGVFALNKEAVSLASINDDVEPQEYMAIYPNPTSNLININFSKETSTVANLIISDLSGKMVYTSTIDNAGVRLNSNDFGSGLYFVTIIGEGYRETKKLIVR